MSELELALNLLIAACSGLAIGFEREWSGHTEGPDARFGGIRTFAFLGGLGGLAGTLLVLPQVAAGVMVAAVGLAFPLAAYVLAMRRSGTTTDSTTEVAAMLVVTIGLISGLGYRAIASGCAAVVLLLLAEKSQLQGWLKRVEETELRATLQFAVLALVVLPLLPDTAFGPFDAIRLRSLWIVVLFFSGLSFAGFIAQRIVGSTRGYGVTGLIGGTVSSTAVAFDFSRKSRTINTETTSEVSAALGLGVVAACTVLPIRIGVVTSVLQLSVAQALVPLLWPPLLVGSAMIGYGLWRSARTKGVEAAPGDHSSETVRNPLRLWSSIKMALVFQLVLIAVAWLEQSTSSVGIIATAAVLGLTDMDALTLSMTKLAADTAQVQTAALAIAVGVLSNTLLKLAVVLVLGSTPFRKVAGTGLVVLAMASGVALWIGM